MMLNKASTSAGEASDVALKKFTQDFAESKIEDRNLKDETWKNLSSRLEPIISSGVNKGVLPTTASTGTTSATNSNQNDIIDLLESKLSRNFKTKGVKLCVLLSRLPGVVITTSKFVVDGKELVGSPLNIIDNLVKPQALLKYGSTILLDKIMFAGLLNEVIDMKLIGNKEAIRYLRDSVPLPVETPAFQPAPKFQSTPKRDISSVSTKTNDGQTSYFTDASEGTYTAYNDDMHSIQSDDDQLVNQKGSGLKSWKWQSLFKKGGKRYSSKNVRGRFRKKK